MYLAAQVMTGHGRQPRKLHFQARECGHPFFHKRTRTFHLRLQMRRWHSQVGAGGKIGDRATIDKNLAARPEELDEIFIRSCPTTTEHKPLNTFRRLQGNMLTNCPTCRMAHHMGRLDLHRVHQSDQVFGHMLCTINQLLRRTGPASAVVMGNDSKVPRKCLYLISPEYAAPAKPRNQKQVWPLASYLNMNFRVANVNSVYLGG